jgi:Uma2 family endonuclease
MSMPAAPDRFYTREEVLAFPEDGNRYELVHGELLVSPAPRLSHQDVVLELALRLAPYVREHGVGKLCLSPSDISWGGSSDVLVQPDLFVVAPHAGTVVDWIDMRHFHLFIEVLSPSTARYDRFTKRCLYQEMQVPLYWVIDLEQRRAEVWTQEATFPIIEARELRWQPPGAAEPFILALDALLPEQRYLHG